eukprot:11950116-Alexandrium_andersonii.AAC.1
MSASLVGSEMCIRDRFKTCVKCKAQRPVNKDKRTEYSRAYGGANKEATNENHRQRDKDKLN